MLLFIFSLAGGVPHRVLPGRGGDPAPRVPERDALPPQRLPGERTTLRRRPAQTRPTSADRSKRRAHLLTPHQSSNCSR